MKNLAIIYSYCNHLVHVLNILTIFSVVDLLEKLLVMATLWNRAGHYTVMLWFLSSSIFYLLFSPRLISAVGDWMSTILRHMLWP